MFTLFCIGETYNTINSFNFQKFGVSKVVANIIFRHIYNRTNFSQVLPGLYVGNYRDSKDPAQLAKHNITHILAIHDTARRLHSVSELNNLLK